MSCAASAYDVSRALPRSALGATRMRWLVASSSRHHGSDTSFGVKMTTPGGRDAKASFPRTRRSSSSGSRTPSGPPRPRPQNRRRDPEPQVASIQIDYLPANLSYVPEREMYTLFCAAAQKSGHDELTAGVLTRTSLRSFFGSLLHACVPSQMEGDRNALARLKCPSSSVFLPTRPLRAGCAVNMYSLGCGYHPSVVKRVLDVLEAPVVANERWAVVLSKVSKRGRGGPCAGPAYLTEACKGAEHCPGDRPD